MVFVKAMGAIREEGQSVEKNKLIDCLHHV